MPKITSMGMEVNYVACVKPWMMKTIESIFCTKYAGTNLCDSLVKFDFRSIFSINTETVDRAIDVVGSLWDLRNGKNEMHLT